jgi:hypothetical protein
LFQRHKNAGKCTASNLFAECNISITFKLTNSLIPTVL